ncbi:MAG: Stp1/IreP family PP2C-type Ser/Thr phosphatase [Desulfobacterales bacterium]
MNEIFKISSAGKTDIGLKRKNNEDRYLILDDKVSGYSVDRLGSMFAVADGMGGHLAGETASRMACDALLAYYQEADNHLSPEKRLARLAEMIQAASKKISDFAFENKAYAGMGTTLSVLVLHQENSLIAHVGDSRIYRLRGNEFKQLTTDHTQVQELVDMGQLTLEEAVYHPLRHILTQAVGREQGSGAIYTRMEKLQKKDVFLLCSDGLHDMMSDDEIKKILLQNPSPKAACEKLVAVALKHGGKDNVTAAVVFCE